MDILFGIVFVTYCTSVMLCVCVNETVVYITTFLHVKILCVLLLGMVLAAGPEQKQDRDKQHPVQHTMYQEIYNGSNVRT